MDRIMMSCKKATELVERNHDNKLTFKDRFLLKFHLLMCKPCNAYEKQSKLLNNALNKFFQNKKAPEAELLKNEALKQKIISQI